MVTQVIQYFFEDVDKERVNTALYFNWLKNNLLVNQISKYSINYIFCSDEHLLKINQDFLSHDYYTDIITFNNSETEDFLESDIFISLDRVQENAKESKTTFECELGRVLVHGLLHLIGYNDKTEEDQETMTLMENKHLALHPNLNC